MQTRWPTLAHRRTSLCPGPCCCEVSVLTTPQLCNMLDDVKTNANGCLFVHKKPVYGIGSRWLLLHSGPNLITGASRSMCGPFSLWELFIPCCCGFTDTPSCWLKILIDFCCALVTWEMTLYYDSAALFKKTAGHSSHYTSEHVHLSCRMSCWWSLKVKF